MQYRYKVQKHPTRNEWRVWDTFKKEAHGCYSIDKEWVEGICRRLNKVTKA